MSHERTSPLSMSYPETGQFYFRDLCSLSNMNWREFHSDFQKLMKFSRFNQGLSMNSLAFSKFEPRMQLTGLPTPVLFCFIYVCFGKRKGKKKKKRKKKDGRKGGKRKERRKK